MINIATVKAKLVQGYAGVMVLMGSTGMASAGTFDNVTTMLTDLVGIFTPILDIVVAVIPIMIALGIATFVIGLLSSILGKIKGKM